MTRRKFVRRLVEMWPVVAASAAALAGRVSTQKARLRKFVIATRTDKYPGQVKPLQDIHTQGKWSG